MAKDPNKLFDTAVDDELPPPVVPAEKPKKAAAKKGDKPRGPGDCPSCGAPTILRTGRLGKFYGCSHYPGCRGGRDYDPELDVPPPPPPEPEYVPPVAPAEPEWSVVTRTHLNPTNHVVYIDQAIAAYVVNAGPESAATARLFAAAPRLHKIAKLLQKNGEIDEAEIESVMRFIEKGQ